MRGEREPVPHAVEPIRGSSPHAWGTVQVTAPLYKHQRFIPTCVGNGQLIQRLRGCDPVHPHMRGERSSAAINTDAACGSSPHAWGTERSHIQLVLAFRFIPTCVGNGHRYSRRALSHPVHPHMRGERCKSIAGRSSIAGSSPHAWGTGIVISLVPWIQTVHPHMRGERADTARSFCATRGSSPHAWGTGQQSQYHEC